MVLVDSVVTNWIASRRHSAPFLASSLQNYWGGWQSIRASPPLSSALGKTTLTSRWRYLDGNAHFFLRELPHSHPDDVGKKE